MSTTAGTILLAIVAAATAVMAVVQVGLAVVAMRLVRRVDGLSARVERDVRPILANVQAVSADAARATALAAAQVERADRLMADMARRVDETATVIQQVVISPAREGRAALSAVIAAVAAFRGVRRRARPAAARSDEEDPLFIG